MEKISFQGYNITPQFMKTDKSIRVIIELSNNVRENIRDILLGRLPEGIYKITIEPLIEE